MGMQLQFYLLIVVCMCGFGFIQVAEGQRGPMEGWMREMTSLLGHYSNCIKASDGETQFEQLKATILTAGKISEAKFRKLLEAFKVTMAPPQTCGAPRTDACDPYVCARYASTAYDKIMSDPDI